ncbi:hypothetical protein NLG97_g9425 [Lecanicillium saksenae]|uniref:Uncharacterized protein n=1 Tax=Lecanicillium saksenae TaxID=468837 RepID=A0ACC1QIS6_9HYPO|nr:hypothetical protein NLG97_g9425 [Lecanicillium saksenae]
MADKTSDKPKRTLEEALKEREEQLRKLREEHQGLAPPEEDHHWLSQTKFSWENNLTEEENQKLNAILQKAFDSNFDPEITRACLEEAKVCLVGHDELLKKYEATFSNVDNKLIDKFRNVCQRGKEKGEGTSQPLSSGPRWQEKTARAAAQHQCSRVAASRPFPLQRASSPASGSVLALIFLKYRTHIPKDIAIGNLARGLELTGL